MKWFPQEYHNLLRLIEFWDVSRNRSQRNPNDTYIHQKEKIKSFMVSLWQLTTQIVTIHSQWMTCSSQKRGGAHTAAAMSDTSSSARLTTSGILDKRHSNTLKIQTIRNMDVIFSMFQLFNCSTGHSGHHVVVWPNRFRKQNNQSWFHPKHDQR